MWVLKVRVIYKFILIWKTSKFLSDTTNKQKRSIKQRELITLLEKRAHLWEIFQENGMLKGLDVKALSWKRVEQTPWEKDDQ